MHDPMTVAHDVVLPIPTRKRWRDASVHDPRRWTLGRSRRTNPENLGEPTYPWWRPTGWSIRFAGRGFGLYKFATIWHVEPGGRDSGEACRHYVRSADPEPSRMRVRLSPFLKEHPRRDTPDDPAAGRGWIEDRAWKWHIRHWRIQVHPWQHFRNRFVRCEECRRRMNRATRIGTGWDAPGVTHMECNELRHARGLIKDADVLIDRALAAYRLAADRTEAQAFEDLIGPGGLGDGWNARWRAVRAYRWRTGRDREEASV